MGSCICGLFPKAGRKGPTLVRFHFIKKKKGEVGVGPKGPATKVPRNNKKKKTEECWDFIVLMVMDG